MDSPSKSKRSRPRRSLSLRTPLRKGLAGEPVRVDSPEIFFGDSPSNLTASEGRLNLCSTPVNHNNQRKRSIFIEEAGSPYLAAESSLDVSGLHCQSPSIMPTMSQEMRRVGVDVVWQWNSPKRHINLDQPNQQQQDGVHPAARKRRKSFTVSSSSNTDGGGTQSSGCATGFYKIREQLLRAKKEDSLFMRLLQEDDFPPTAVDDSKAAAVTQKTKEDDSKDVTLTRKLSDELLNDSDNDENLLIISQETEKKVLELEQQQQLQMKDQKLTEGSGGKQKSSTSAIQSREMSFTINDSFDQFLIDIPFDELLNRNAGALDETVVNTSSSTPMPRVLSGRKGSLSRTQSMPPEKKNKEAMEGEKKKLTAGGRGGGSSSSCNTSNSRIMARHESMPTSSRNRSGRNTRDSGGSEEGGGVGGCAMKYSVSNPSLPGIPMSSSTESLLSSTSSTEKTRVCSQTEIARKRQIAQERLKLKQRQQQQQLKK